MYLKPISNITIILVTIRLQAKTYFTIESKTRQMEQLRRSKKEPKRSKRSKMVKTNSDLNTQKWTWTQLKQKQMKHRNKASWARKNEGFSSEQCVTVTRRIISDANNNRWPAADQLVFFRFAVS